MQTSLFDLFKIGIGPSSSHTVGPMRAAYRFVRQLSLRALLTNVARVRVELYGSLALTGHGHGTDRGVLLGLLGKQPDEVDPAEIDELVGMIRGRRRITLFGSHDVPLDGDDLVFHKDALLPGHSNGMCFTAFDKNGGVLVTKPPPTE
jgi:L-serine dehydratase